MKSEGKPLFSTVIEASLAIAFITLVVVSCVNLRSR